MRFFAPLRQLSDRDVTRFTNVDYHDRVALVATVRGEIIGIGRYDRITPTSAEVAFNISDSYQGRGIGSVLLEHLAVIAWEAGVDGVHRRGPAAEPQDDLGLQRGRLRGEPPLRGRRRLARASRSSRPSGPRRSGSPASTAPSRSACARCSSPTRSRSSARAGAPTRSATTSWRTSMAAGFNGAVHAVNREAHGGARAAGPRPRLGDPRRGRPRRRRGARRTRCSTSWPTAPRPGSGPCSSVSAGFAESGPDGEELQSAAPRRRPRGRDAGLGPNSFGVINNDPDGAAQRLARPRAAAAGSARPLRPERGPRHRGARVRGPPRAGHLRVRLRRQPRRRLGQRLHAVLDRRRQHRRGRASTSSRWATRASSRASPGGWRRPSRVIVVKSGVSSYGVPPGHRARHTRVRPRPSTRCCARPG